MDIKALPDVWQVTAQVRKYKDTPDLLSTRQLVASSSLVLTSKCCFGMKKMSSIKTSL